MREQANEQRDEESKKGEECLMQYRKKLRVRVGGCAWFGGRFAVVAFTGCVDVSGAVE